MRSRQNATSTGWPQAVPLAEPLSARLKVTRTSTSHRPEPLGRRGVAHRARDAHGLLVRELALHEARVAGGRRRRRAVDREAGVRLAGRRSPAWPRAPRRPEAPRRACPRSARCPWRCRQPGRRSCSSIGQVTAQDAPVHVFWQLRLPSGHAVGLPGDATPSRPRPAPSSRSAGRSRAGRWPRGDARATRASPAAARRQRPAPRTRTKPLPVVAPHAVSSASHTADACTRRASVQWNAAAAHRRSEGRHRVTSVNASAH